ncbi:hypothetical protein LB507_005373 [Fusarium sp. FIESC RH6]|nr:hypothetical protein LB507_005373 [Fusarium sp. FIESC RH6]
MGSKQSPTDSLHSSLNEAGIHNLISTSPAWSENTTQYQKRIKPNPACIAFPEDKDQLSKCLKCARENSVKVSALGPGHSFQGLGFGTPGSLVINMEAFNSMHYDEDTELLTYGGGTRVGPVAKYLWDTAGRHFPHVRGSNVGVTGSSIGCGFGTTSRFLGTPMDNIVAVEFMLCDGSVVVAEEGSDLLWAAKGAAASFGIILSLTTKTYKPKFDKAVTFNISLGDVDVDKAAEAFIAVQNYGTNSDCPDELAIRWSLVNWNIRGYFYGDPSSFDKTIKPLLESLEKISSETTLEKKELDFWDMEVYISGEGMNRSDGGDLKPLCFYLQSIVITNDHPLTVAQARLLLNDTTVAFNRTDMTPMGYIDLWGGVNRSISDKDTAHPHANNLWLIRWDANSLVKEIFPPDGVEYLRGQMMPFEKQLKEDGVNLRGFVNYADTEWTREEMVDRLYGENWERLVRIKEEVDPEGLFSSNSQSVTVEDKKIQEQSG